MRLRDGKAPLHKGDVLGAAAIARSLIRVLAEEPCMLEILDGVQKRLGKSREEMFADFESPWPTTLPPFGTLGPKPACGRMLPPTVAEHKVGRNDPCP